MINKSLYSSKTDNWATPQDLFDALHQEFNFTLDPCAGADNAKCPKYFSVDDNGLIQDWSGHTVFCNPPYGRNSTGDWIKKCAEESQKPGTKVVMLIPARTDTKAFHKYINPGFISGKIKIRFIAGRVKFGGSSTGAPFPSILVIFA